MTTLVVMSVVVIVALVAVLAIYLFWIGRLLGSIADNLEESNATVRAIVGHARLIVPGVEHINRTGGVVAGALPLLYGHAERIDEQNTPLAARGNGPVTSGGRSTGPPLGRRRSRLTDAVGYRRHEPR